MLSVWMMLLISVTVECQECNPCPDGCICNQRRAGLDCNGLGLISVVPGFCGDEIIEEVNFSNNDIAIIHFQNIPLVGGTFCEIDVHNNKITRSTGTITFEDCTFLEVNLSNNSLKTLHSNFLVAYGDLKFVDIILTHNSISEIMPGAIKMYNSSDDTGLLLDVDLSFNKVSYIHPGAFDLDVFIFDLNLQNNKLVSFSILSAWRSVLHTGTPYPLDLDLSNNLIEELQLEDEDSEYANIYRRITLNVVNNPWNCDCNHKRIAYDNSTLRGMLIRSIQRHAGPHEPVSFQPSCATPDAVRRVPILALSQDDFVCPPRLDSTISNTDIKTILNETITLFCPVTFAEPPITHYIWTFTPQLSATQLEIIGEEIWDVRFSRQTTVNRIAVESARLEGVYECRAVSPAGTLSVNISVSYPKTQETLTSKFPENVLDESTTVPACFVGVLSIFLCVVTILFSVAGLALFVVSVKYFNLLRSQKVSVWNTGKESTKRIVESTIQKVESRCDGRNIATVDYDGYCVPSNALKKKDTDTDIVCETHIYETQMH